MDSEIASTSQIATSVSCLFFDEDKADLKSLKTRCINIQHDQDSDFRKRFTHIVNHLVALDKTFSKGELTNKVLRCLDRNWQPKVTAIMESKDLYSMALATLFSKLQEHEMELGRLTLNEELDKRKKGISLKASTSQDQEDKDDYESDSEIDTETMTLLKVYGEKNTSRDFKSKKPYIVWDVPEESSTTSTYEEEETAKICLMNNELDEVNSYDSSSCSSSSNLPTYDELYNAFVELHEELKNLAKVNVYRKRIILLQEKKIASMQKEMDELKLENETLDLIYSSASCMCSTKVIQTPVCETCCELKMKNDELKNKITQFTYNSQNLNRLLDSSKNTGNRTGLGFKHKSKKRPFRKHAASKSHVINHKLPTCFYCGVHGHTSSSCYIKRLGVPSGKYVWVAKCAPSSVTNKKGPNITWVPKSKYVYEHSDNIGIAKVGVPDI
ncbi:hypothetical protein Lal_00042356 [Lupinus albus]|nr:hypothetical protein Lal_00042356 [Lupinus albus]